MSTKNFELNVSASAQATLEYDANGNLLCHKDGSGAVLRMFTWDAENRLLTFQSSDTPANGVKRTEFGYDGVGRRISQVEKEHNGSTWITLSAWTYIWDDLELAQRRDTVTGAVLGNNFSGGETLGADAIVYLNDHLASVRRWYRVSDGLVGQANFGLFGERDVVLAGPGVPERGYCGHIHHGSSGLIVTVFRAYDPVAGSWITRDPIGETVGPNVYAYVENAPDTRVDFYGLDWYNPLSWNWDMIGAGFQGKFGLALGIGLKAQVSKVKLDLLHLKAAHGVYGAANGEFGTYLDLEASLIRATYKDYQVGLGGYSKTRIPNSEKGRARSDQGGVCGFKRKKDGTDASYKSSELFKIGVGATIPLLEAQGSIDFGLIYRGITDD